MITARSAFQIYKAEEASGSVSDFNSLAIEDVLPYKIASAEETLLASLDIVETDAEHRARYAVSTLHAAAAYVSHLISYVPLSARSQTAKKIDIHYDALVRTVMIFCSQDAGLFAAVKNMVVRSAPADQVSLKELSDVEGALTAMEKEYRQKAKDAGERVDMLRKVAPEPPVVVVATTTSSSSLPLTPPPSGDASTAAGTSPGKRRPRSQSGDAAGNAAEAAEGEGSELKVTRVEGEAAATTAAAATRTAGKSRRTKAGGGPASAAAGVGGLVWGRLRALTPNEKKAVGVLQTIVQVLAHVYATRVNDLVPLFDLLEEKVKTVQTLIDTERTQYEAKEDKKPPEPFHEVDLTALSEALATSSHLFRTDEECRYELDEDLLHPIAHACLTVMNHIEGYATAPFVPPSPEELDKKQQLRDAARAKREEAKRRIIEKAEAKAELERKREEEKQLMRRRLGDHDPDEDDDRLVEDMVLANPSPLGYVAYAADLPLGSAALYEQALFVWSMIVSVPRALNLSQMHFDTFLRGIQCEDQDANGFMEEVTRCLLEVSMEAVRIGSPNTPRITTRGKNWFDALVEFVGVASGTKQKRRQQQRRREPSVEEEEEEDEEESSTDSTSEEEDGDDSSENSDSGTEAESEQEQEPQRSSDANTSPTTAAAAEEKAPTAEDVAAAARPEEVEEVDTDPFMEELKATMDNITRLRALATWGNVDACDRLNLLRFCVQEALSSEGVRAEADRLQKEVEEEVGITERRLKEIRDEAEKELKALLRTLPAATASVSGGAATRRTGRSRKAAAVKKEGEKNDEDHDADNDSEKDGEDEDAREATYEAEREAILQAVDRKRAEVHASVFGKQDGQDNGAVVEPIGMDRYKRLYWRFPLQRDIFVQTAPQLTHTLFPVLPEPAELRRKATSTRALLLDEEDVLSSTRSKGRSTPPPPSLKAESTDGAAQSAVTTQTEWGVIPAAYLATFAQTLDRRGRREGPLRHALEMLVPYLSQMEEAKEARTTRARATMFGYYNQLKTDFSY